MSMLFFGLILISVFIGFGSFMAFLLPLCSSTQRSQYSYKYFVGCLIVCFLCAASAVFVTWMGDMNFREEILSKKENENSDHLKDSKGTIKKIGDSFEVRNLSRYEDEYSIGYKDEKGELQWVSLSPYNEQFLINIKKPNIRVVLDEKRTQSTLVREKNRFILREPKFFGGPVKEYYPMYTLYLSNETKFESIEREKLVGKIHKRTNETILINNGEVIK